MRTVIFVPNPTAWRRDGAPGGLALLERQMKQLRELAHEPPLLLVPKGDPVPVLPDGLEVSALVRVPVDGRTPAGALADACQSLPGEFLFLAADRLVDRRVLVALAACEAPVFASNGAGVPEPVARLSAAAVRIHGTALPARAACLPLETLEPYVPELRGEAAPYIVSVDSADERRAAWRILLDHAQKRCLDLPGRYFDTPFENAFVRWLAPTRITPNQITLATTVLAGVVGWLFLRGWLLVGVFLALLVGVLDGVDGKLARLKLATSKLGELEHVADFFYENFWYLALGMHLRAATGVSIYVHAAVSLVALDLCDSLLYAGVRARTGRMLDELSRFDRAFRGVAGRRNVYVWIFMVGFLGGHAGGALIAAALWAAVTVAVHGWRAAQVLRSG